MPEGAHTRIQASRPKTNGDVEALHETILDECWRPAFARYLYPRLVGLRRELDTDRSLAAVGAVRGRPLDAVFVVADRLQRVMLRAQLRGVLGDAQAGRFTLGVLQDLDVDLLSGAGGALVVFEVPIQPAGGASALRAGTRQQQIKPFFRPGCP